MKMLYTQSAASLGDWTGFHPYFHTILRIRVQGYVFKNDSQDMAKWQNGKRQLH